MMTASRLLTAISLSLLAGFAAVPGVLAYLPPEEVLTETSNETSLVDPEHGSAYDEEYEDERDWEIEMDENEEDLPSGIRPVGPTIQYRDQPSKNNHSMLKKYQSSSSVAEEYAAAEVDEEDMAFEDEDNAQVIQLDLGTMRLLERLANRKSAPQQQVILSVLPDSMHSGAPLTPTGPATVIAMGAMLGAIGYTVRRAGKMAARR